VLSLVAVSGLCVYFQQHGLLAVFSAVAGCCAVVDLLGKPARAANAHYRAFRELRRLLHRITTGLACGESRAALLAAAEQEMERIDKYLGNAERLPVNVSPAAKKQPG